jgi:hypothetical protein
VTRDAGSELQARVAARASVTARLHALHDTCPGLLVEAVRTDPDGCLGELSSLTLTANKVAALALDAAPTDVLAVLVLSRAAATCEPAREEG